MQTAIIQIAGRELKLSVLPKREVVASRKAFHALAVAQLAPVASNPWLKAYTDAAGFLFLAARGNHRDLRIDDLDDAEPEEIFEGFKVFSRLMYARWGRLWEAPGNGSGDGAEKTA
jgi:hypothetical protein